MVGNTLVAFSTFIIVALGIAAGFGFLIFAYWWYRVGDATPAYQSITGMFLGISVTAWVAVVGRYLYSIKSNTAYESWVHLPLWSIGPLIILIFCVRAIYKQVQRIVRTYLYLHGYLEDRRRKDRRH